MRSEQEIRNRLAIVKDMCGHKWSQVAGERLEGRMTLEWVLEEEHGL